MARQMAGGEKSIMNDILQKTIIFVDNAFGDEKKHFDRTLFWLLELKPDADLAFHIAAYAHDVERAFKAMGTKRFLIYEDHQELINHQLKSAEIVYSFLVDNKFDIELAERTKHLISKHEDGGDEDQNLLKDADSISYLETNAPKHVSEMAEGIFHSEEVREKFEYMFDRITDLRARSIAKPMYEEVIRLLDEKTKSLKS